MNGPEYFIRDDRKGEADFRQFREQIRERMHRCENAIQNMDQAVLMHEISMIRAETFRVFHETNIRPHIDEYEECIVRCQSAASELAEKHGQLNEVFQEIDKALSARVRP